MRRLLNIVALVLVLDLIVCFAISAPAQATGAIVLNPTNGTVGSTVTISGSGYTAGETINATFDTTAIITGFTSIAATWSTSFVVPTAISGSHVVNVSGTSTSVTTSNFVVTPKITVGQTTGSGIIVQGSGFAASETVSISVDGNSVNTTTAGANGSWVSNISGVAAGTRSITASGGAGSNATTTFNVISIPTIVLGRTSGLAGTSVTIGGSGFNPNETGITVTFDGTQIGSSTVANSIGSWTLTAAVPAASAGSHSIAASGSVTPNASTSTVTFTITPGLTLNKSSGTAGTGVTASGSGFGAGETGISVSYDGNPVGTPVTANTAGGWTTTFIIPAGPAGSHIVGASGSSTAAGSVPTSSFTVSAGISLNKSSGGAGTSVTASGSGFGSGETGITVTYDGNPVGTPSTANPAGGWTATFVIPPGPAGAHPVSAYGANTAAGSVPSVNFTIGASISVNKTGGSAGTSITVDGAGFGAGEAGIKLTFDGSPVATPTTASASGSWSITFNVPSSPGGTHTIAASGSSTAAISVPTISFSSTSGLNINLTSGSVGSSVTISGSGMGANETGISVTYDGNPLGSQISADASGAWTGTFVIPASPAGSHPIAVKGSSTSVGGTGNLSFKVTPSISSNSASGYVGATVNLNGSGYGSNSALRFTYDDQALNDIGTVTTDNSGSFTRAITVPASKAGPHVIKVQDAQGNSSNLNFAINVVTLSPPHPISPDDGSKLGLTGDITPDLRWSPVTDPNGGITYSLQIDTDPDFPHPLIQKTGLTVAHYTLSQTESLPNGTYYWRVQAFDTAANQSAWSQTVTLKSGVMSASMLVFLIVVVIAAVLAGLYMLLVRPALKKKKMQEVEREAQLAAEREAARQLARAPEAPEIVMSKVVDGDYRTIDQDSSRRKLAGALPWRLALPQSSQPARGGKNLSRQDQARLKVIIDFTKSIHLIEPGNNTAWLVDLAESVSGETSSPALYSKLLKSEIQLHYEPAWMRHPTFADLQTLLEGQPILEDLSSFVDSVNFAASEGVLLLQDIYRDTSAEVNWDILASDGWGFISGVYIDSLSWFLGKYLREPSERDYSIKEESKTQDGSSMFALNAEQNVPFGGLLVKTSDDNEALRLRALHLKLRRTYRNNGRAKEVVASIAQLDVQRSRLLNDFSQFSRLNP